MKKNRKKWHLFFRKKRELLCEIKCYDFYSQIRKNPQNAEGS